MARKSKKIDHTQPIDGEVVDLRTDVEKALENPPFIPVADEPQQLALTKDELARLQLSQFQTRAFEAERNLAMLQRDLFLKQIDPEGRLQQLMALIRGRTDEAVVAKNDYAKVVNEIENRLKISLKEYAYDDLNGNLTKID
jgi:hypothetical protein